MIDPPSSGSDRRIQVRFVNNPVVIAVATSMAPQGGVTTPEAEVSGRNLSSGVFEFKVTAPGGGPVIDQEFAVFVT